MDTGRLDAASRAIGLETASIFVRIETNEARKVARRGPEALATWAGKFYGRRLTVLVNLLVPRVEWELARLGARADAAAVARNVATAYAERSRRELLSLSGPELERSVERLCERWKLTRAAELVDAVSAAARLSA